MSYLIAHAAPYDEVSGQVRLDTNRGLHRAVWILVRRSAEERRETGAKAVNGAWRMVGWHHHQIPDDGSQDTDDRKLWNGSG